MVGWRNNFGPIESGNSDIDFISIGLAHESQRAAARRTEGADAPGPFNFTRLTFSELKIVSAETKPMSQTAHRRSYDNLRNGNA